MAAALAGYPEMSLFPLPLAATNVIAPDAAAFLPGDLVGITVVIGARPQPPITPTPPVSVFTIPGSILEDLPTNIPEQADWVYTTTLTTALPGTESEAAEALARAAPPLAKDLFPQGVRVIAVQGLPQNTVSAVGDERGNPGFTGLPEEELLMLLVPNGAREQLGLALQRADQVFVSLLARGDTERVTPGFTYWDFEDLFAADRKEVFEAAGDIEPTNIPITPTVTPGP